jgi:plastocyanin
MKTNKLFLMLLTCLFASSVSATIYTVNAGLPYYSPSNLSINVGDTVEWINDGGTHDVNADVNSQTGLSFNNPVSFQSNTTNVVGAKIHTQVFNVLGNYSYDCSVGSHAANGMVGTISVNVPPNSIYDIVSNSPDHTTLNVAILACGLDGTLSGGGPFTLFAPTDAAFNLLPAGTVAALLAEIPQLTDI